MAIYFCRASHGKIGKAIPHYEYINGLEKYNYKKDEIAYQIENMPNWVTNGKDFFQMSDNFERANGMSYKELKLALPHELSLSQNKKLLNDFLTKEFNNKYYYSAVIHHKESGDKNKNIKQNIHVHLMFSTRELDNIERSGKKFFSRANKKNPELGGNAKNPKWDSKNIHGLKEIRLSWEQTLNKTLEEHNIEKISCLSLKEQYQNAIKEGDLFKANMLNRKPINIQMQIIKKVLDDKPLNKWENKQYKKHLKNTAIKYSLEKDYKEIKELQKSLNSTKEEIKNIEKNIKPLNKEFINPIFKDFLDIENKILMVEKELEFTSNASSFSAIKISAITNFNKEYKYLNKELDVYIDKLVNITGSTNIDDILVQEYTEKISSLKESLNAIEKSIDQIDLAKSISNETEKCENKLNELNSLKESLLIQRESFYKNSSTITLDKVSSFNKFGSCCENIIELEWELKNINKLLNQTQSKLDHNYIKETAKDILTKGKYKKNIADTEKCIDKINILVREINGGIYDNRPDILKQKNLEHTSLINELKELQNINFDSFFDKNYYKLESIEISLKEKLENRKENLFNRQCILEQEIAFYKLYTLQDKGKEAKEILEGKIYNYSKESQNNEYKEQKFKAARENLNKIFEESNIKKLAYNKLTGGQYNKLIKEYDNLDKNLNILHEQKKSLGVFSLKNIYIGKEISKIEKQKIDLQNKFHKMIDEIDPIVLDNTIKDLKKIKLQAEKKIKSKEKEYKNEKYKSNFKGARLKQMSKKIKSQTPENYKQKIKSLHNIQSNKNDIGHSNSLFNDDDYIKKLSEYYNAKGKDNDLDIGF